MVVDKEFLNFIIYTRYVCVKEIDGNLKFRYKDEAINLAPMGISKYFG